jgi:ribose transport system ATP-binding protein
MRLLEWLTIANRVTVLRDGELVGTKPIVGVTKQQIINMMAGRVMYEQSKTSSNVVPDAPVVLCVDHLNAGERCGMSVLICGREKSSAWLD